jgi:putative PIN family toxin of toxin-antitoxin system
LLENYTVSKNRPRIFLDSNVIFSGFYSPQRVTGKILRLCVDGKIILVISRQVLDETMRNAKRKAQDMLEPLTRFLITVPVEVVANPEPLEIKQWSQQLSAADASVLLAAIAAKPDYFVTGDNHFLRNPDLEKLTALRIITPAQLLQVPGIDN